MTLATADVIAANLYYSGYEYAALHKGLAAAYSLAIYNSYFKALPDIILPGHIQLFAFRAYAKI